MYADPVGFWQSVHDYLAGYGSSVSMDAPAPAAKFEVTIPPELLEAMTGGEEIAPRISRREALQVPAVLRARNMIAGTLASLPHLVHGPDKQVIDTTYLLAGNIDPDVPNSIVLAQTYEDLLFEGISWWRVTGFGFHGFPVQARHVPFGSVHVAQTGSLPPSRMRISADQPFPAEGQVFIDGVPVPDREIIRFDSPNPPLLRHAARAIRAALRLDRTAAMYADEPLPQIVLEPQEGADLLDDTPGSAGDDTDRSEIDVLLDRWGEARRAHTAAYLGGLKANMLGWSPDQLQLAEARQHAVLEIARAAGVDPEDLGVSTTSRTYANQEQRWQAMQNLTFGPLVTAVQDRLSMRDMLPRGYTVRVNFAAFLRSDTVTRMQAYQIGKPLGAYTVEEIRELEDRPALTPAQKAAIAPAAVPQQPPAQPTAGVQQETDPADEMAQVVNLPVSFDDTETLFVQFDDEDTETFQVDIERRTIMGLAVPWGKVARSGFTKWRFAPDSLTWSDVSRIKLNLHHDRTQLIGRATRLQSGSRGLMATFKVARDVDGDRALARAEDRILDGFSIEVDFDDSKGDSWQPDPSDESVRLVTQASLRGTALTGTPAFDDARVTRVAASDHNREGIHAHGHQDQRQDGGGRSERRVRVRFRGVH